MKPAGALDAKLTLFYRVKDGLGIPRGEPCSIADWCGRMLWRWRGRKWRAAWIILNGRGDPWADLAYADRILRGIAHHVQVGN